MKKTWMIVAIGLAVTLLAMTIGRRLRASAETTAAEPRYTPEGRLIRPDNYRQWIYVSSGLGMNYGPASGFAPAFTNVFVEPGAYKHYIATGQWPDKTMFVLEVYSASSHGSIIKQGQYQDALLGVEAEVKDESRFPEKWAYFGFGPAGKTASKIPQDDCWSCHNKNAAVENSFVQFYPALLGVAYDKGTIKPSIHLAPTAGRIEHMAMEQGWAAAGPMLDQLRSTDPAADALKEPSLNALGYKLLGSGKNADAVAVFERAARDYPRSPNAWDSLADGYVTLGNKAKAIECSEKALELLRNVSDLSDGMRRNIENSAKQRLAKLKS